MRWKETARSIPIVACALAAYFYGLPGIILLAGWCVVYRIDAAEWERTARHWHGRVKLIDQKLDKVLDHAAADPPSPEEELLADTRRRVLTQWREEGIE